MNIRKMLHHLNSQKSKFDFIQNGQAEQIHVQSSRNLEVQNCQLSKIFSPLGITQPISEFSHFNQNCEMKSISSTERAQTSQQKAAAIESPATFRLTIKKKKSKSYPIEMNKTISNLSELGITQKPLSHRDFHSRNEKNLKCHRNSTRQQILNKKQTLPSLQCSKQSLKKRSFTTRMNYKLHKSIYNTIDCSSSKHQKILPHKKSNVGRRNSIAPWQLQIQDFDTLF